MIWFDLALCAVAVVLLGVKPSLGGGAGSFLVPLSLSWLVYDVASSNFPDAPMYWVVGVALVVGVVSAVLSFIVASALRKRKG